MTRRKLPIGVQTFAKIISGDYYYVDKTALILRLAQESGYFFLSRPRRFGKSLLLDTLAELFAGNEPLFRGLFIHDQWDWKRRLPVIRFSFGGGIVTNVVELERKIREQLRINQVALGLSCTETGVDGCLGELIRAAHATHGERVVVLVDEYDKPILDNLNQPDVARAIRDGLRNLYSVIKDMDAHIRFAFLTGVSKFSKVSLFSGLNNLNDITLDAAYSAICGYTEADLERVFAPELPGLDREDIRIWYNGYNWLGESVYNPFDILLLFDKRTFHPWWFETGTPTFLIDLLAKIGFFTPNLARLRTGPELLSTFDVDHIAPEALLFQTGYLTILKAEEPIRGHWVYTLGYPNREVESSLNTSLLATYTANPSTSASHRLALMDLLLAHDIAGLKTLFQAFYASIPNDWYRNNPLARYEGYYASVFYSYFAALGLDIILEDVTQRGRIDMTVRFNRRIYLFEFNVVEISPEGRALRQLQDRGYADKYRAEGCPIHLIGVEFSREDRNIVGFEVETVAT